MSNGEFTSVEHRAVVDRKRLRMTVGLAMRPELTATMAPAVTLLGKGEQPKFKATNYGEYLKQQQQTLVLGKSAFECQVRKALAQPQ